MIQYEKSSLPKLLATENITIKHGNFPTAWFDIKNRVLGLPLWKDMGKDVYDDHKKISPIWWLLTKWNFNSMADKPNSSNSFS